VRGRPHRLRKPAPVAAVEQQPQPLVGPFTYSTVQHTAERVVIVASGPSLRNVTLNVPYNISVIAVNGALDHVPRADFWFTLDTSPDNRTLMRTAATRTDTVFYAAVRPDYGHPDATPRHMKAKPEANVLYLRRMTDEGPRGSKRGLSEDPTGIHCGNSAYGALGLAYLMGAKRIALLGVDGVAKAGYAWRAERQPRDLQHIARLFASACEQLKDAGVAVVVGSKDSKVKCWPRMRPEEAVAWASE